LELGAVPRGAIDVAIVVIVVVVTARRCVWI
jgi:hypothetical protein